MTNLSVVYQIIVQKQNVDMSVMGNVSEIGRLRSQCETILVKVQFLNFFLDAFC